MQEIPFFSISLLFFFLISYYLPHLHMSFHFPLTYLNFS